MKVQSLQNEEPSPTFLMAFLFGVLCNMKNMPNCSCKNDYNPSKIHHGQLLHFAGLNAVHSKIFKHPLHKLLHFAGKTKRLLCKIKNISKQSQTPAKCKTFRKMRSMALKSQGWQAHPNKAKPLQNARPSTKSGPWPEHPRASKCIQTKPNPCKMQDLPQNEDRDHRPKIPRLARAFKNSKCLQNKKLAQNQDQRLAKSKS